MIQVLITQPYVPAYRVPLFNAIHDKLAARGVSVSVVAGNPSGAQAARGDAHRAEWQEPLREVSVPVGRWRLALRTFPRSVRPDLVVSELEALNTLAWQRSFRSSRLVLWGHGKPYVNRANWLSERLEWALARRSTAVMTYTAEGRRYLLEHGGLSPGKVTAIGNSTDSARLRAGYLSVTDSRIEELTRRYGRGPIALFVGGLDATKRIDFLLDAAREAHRIQPDFRLVIVGRGALQAEVLAAAAPGGPIIHIPEARGDELSELGHVASAVWMPGRVGLVAVDAIALNLPVFTTNYEFHAPEIDFLREDEREFLPDDALRFAEDALALMTRKRPPLRDDFPTIEAVSDEFVRVVTQALGDGIET